MRHLTMVGLSSILSRENIKNILNRLNRLKVVNKIEKNMKRIQLIGLIQSISLALFGGHEHNRQSNRYLCHNTKSLYHVAPLINLK